MFLQRVFLVSTLLRTSSHCELVFKSLTFPWRHYSHPSVETSSTEVAASTLENNIKYNTKVSGSQQRQNSTGRTREQKSTQIRPFDSGLYRNLLGRYTVAACTQEDLSCWQSWRYLSLQYPSKAAEKSSLFLSVSECKKLKNIRIAWFSHSSYNHGKQGQLWQIIFKWHFLYHLCLYHKVGHEEQDVLLECFVSSLFIFQSYMETLFLSTEYLTVPEMQEPRHSPWIWGLKENHRAPKPDWIFKGKLRKSEVKSNIPSVYHITLTARTT